MRSGDPNNDSSVAAAIAGVPMKTIEHVPSQNEQTSEPVPGPNGELRILLVDDHKDTREALTKLLVRKGYKVQSAQDVASAIKLADTTEFDMLVSDIGLPDGSGLDIMEHIREQHDIPGIALSGFGMQQDIERSKQAGFREHLTKPVNFGQLQAAISRHSRAAASRS